MNPRNYRQKVATDKISSFGKEHKFHFTLILETWFNV
jgi:hypothetical protein